MQSKTNQVLMLDSVKQRSSLRGQWVGKNLWMRGNYMQFFERRIAIVDRELVCKSPAKLVDVDDLIVTEISPAKEKLVDNYAVRKAIVIAPTIPGYKAQKMERWFASSKMVVYNMEKLGAFRESF